MAYQLVTKGVTRMRPLRRRRVSHARAAAAIALRGRLLSQTLILQALARAIGSVHWCSGFIAPTGASRVGQGSIAAAVAVSQRRTMGNHLVRMLFFSASEASLSARRFSERGTCLREKFSNSRPNVWTLCARGKRVLLLILYTPVIWRTTNSLSEKHSTAPAPSFFASSRARMRAVYSAKLFVAFPIVSLSSQTVPPVALLMTAPIAEGPGFPREAPSKKIFSFIMFSRSADFFL